MNKEIKSAIKVLKQFNKNNYEAFFVGGFVRDYIINKSLRNLKNNDIDISTNCLPEDVKTIFEKSKFTGEKYGTTTVFMDKFKFEVTTYRKDFLYLDSRHPSKIVFSNNKEDDVIRRDFTINALFMDKDLKIIDLIGGLDDIKNQVLRSIGNPNDRFLEDSLRILRLFYFYAKLKFNIDFETLKSAINLKNEMKKLSFERIYQEFNKINSQTYRYEALMLMNENGIDSVFPEFLKTNIFLKNKNNSFYFDKDIYYQLTYYLNNKKMDNFYHFSNKEIKSFNDICDLIELYKTGQYELKKLFLDYELEDIINSYYIFNNLESNITYKFIKKYVVRNYNKNKIKKIEDIKISSLEIIEFFNKKPGNWISDIKREISYLILDNKLRNNKKEILRYLENAKNK